jgi:hypothetical protein
MARENGITMRALVVINPGNPTGQVCVSNLSLCAAAATFYLNKHIDVKMCFCFLLYRFSKNQTSRKLWSFAKRKD